MKPLALIVTQYPLWLRRARYYAGNDDDAQDALQSAAESLLRRDVDVDHPVTYLTSVIRNQARDRRRRDERRRQREMAFEPPPPLEPPDPQRVSLARRIREDLSSPAQRRAIHFYVRRKGGRIPAKHRVAMAHLRQRLTC